MSACLLDFFHPVRLPDGRELPELWLQPAALRALGAKEGEERYGAILRALPYIPAQEAACTSATTSA